MDPATEFDYEVEVDGCNSCITKAGFIKAWSESGGSTAGHFFTTHRRSLE